MKTLVATSAALVAVVCLGAASAQADSHYGHNHGGHNHGSTSSFTPVGPTGGYSYAPTSYPSYVPAPRYVRVQPRRQRAAVWHDTTHVDETPGQWVYGPNGLTYVPPRRTLHVDGHYDVVDTDNHDHGYTYFPVRRRALVVYP